MSRKIWETLGGSLVIGELPEGCYYCMQGDKLVIFITGLCENRCFYCPISEERRGRDVVYANEKRVRTYRDILKEAKLSEAKGAGITGGEPLLKISRVYKTIKTLKENFGSEFHIHLYTSGVGLTRRIVKKLDNLGLDEIRFHPVNDKTWEQINLALETSMKVGVEIPVIPNAIEYIKEKIKYLTSIGAHFLNLNELEFSETNASELISRNFKLSKNSVTAVSGSEEAALEILNWAKNYNSNLSIHYCPSRLKDSVQLKNRLIKRARNVSKEFEEVTEEGLLLKGVIWGNGLSQLKILKKILISKYNVPENMIWLNPKKSRLETSVYIVKKLAGEVSRKGFRVAIVEQYPTENGPDIYVDPIN